MREGAVRPRSRGGGTQHDPPPHAGPTGSAARVVVWGFHMALPLLGLWLLLARPELDVVWEDHLSHFWLVLAVAGINVVLGARMSRAASDRGDARLYLVSLAFLSSAGFFLLHALATPGVVVSGKNGGFVLASPAGVLMAGAFAAASSLELPPPGAAAVMRARKVLSGGLVLLMAAWAVISLLELPPLAAPLEAEDANRSLRALAVIGVPLYLVAATRFYRLYRRRRAVVLLSVITAVVLLAEAMAAMASAPAWQASWWEWHVLLVAGFGFVAYSAHVQYRREGSETGLWTGISLEENIRRLRREYGAALEQLVEGIGRHGEASDEQAIGPLVARVAARFDLTEGQAEVLRRAAEALAHEREQIERLDALVAVGREARVIVEERYLLTRTLALAAGAFRRDRLRVGLVEEGRLRFPQELSGGPDGLSEDDAHRRALESLEPVEISGDGAARMVLPLTVKGHGAGVLEVDRPVSGFAARDRSVLQSLASQLSIALENARLYRQIDALFRQYMSPDVATALLADPQQAALGGAVVEVTVLFADLRGYTTYSERTPPGEVVALLNRYFGIAVPIVLREGGTVAQFVGDALMAMWGAPTRQPDHAVRAGRAALEIQRAIQGLTEEHPEWPRFRIGVNSGPALVGNIGSEEFRNYTAIGDTTNLASRLETAAEVGTVLVGERTSQLLGDAALVRPVGELLVKGKDRPVRAFILEGLR